MPNRTTGASPARQLEGFLGRYTPEVRALARRALAKLRRQVPGAVELVYDNYNALVIGFGPSARASEAIFSIAVYPRWVNLFFLQGVRLADPHKVLKGGGKHVRHIRLGEAEILDEPAVRKLISQASKAVPKPVEASQRRRMVIKSVSWKQRSRLPGA